MQKRSKEAIMLDISNCESKINELYDSYSMADCITIPEYIERNRQALENEIFWLKRELES